MEKIIEPVIPIAKSTICRCYCTNCKCERYQILTRVPGKENTYFCGFCGVEKRYSFKKGLKKS